MENKPYKNYARPAAPTPAAKINEVKEESVAANAVEESPSVYSIEDEVVIKPAVLIKPIVEEKKAAPAERVNDIAEVVKKNVKVVDVDYLNVRSSPDFDAPNVVGLLKRNTRVNVTEEVGEFSKIGDKRYVMSKFLV